MSAVLGTVRRAAGELVAFASFSQAQPILARHHQGVSLGHPGVPGAVLAAGLMLGLCSLLGLALGAIVRHTAGGIAATIAVIVVPSILGLLPAPWNGRIGRFTLLDAAGQVTALHPAAGLFSPGVPAGPAGLAGRRPGGGRGPHHPPGRLRPARRWTLRHWKLGRWPRPRPPARSA